MAMKINTSTDYAIRILICLAKAGHVVSSSQLSQDLNISSRYVLLVLAKLQNAGSLPPATADLGALIRQLQEQPGLASTLAQLLNGAVQGTTG